MHLNIFTITLIFIVPYNFCSAEDTLYSLGGCIVDDVFWHGCFPETGKPLM